MTTTWPEDGTAGYAFGRPCRIRTVEPPKRKELTMPTIEEDIARLRTLLRFGGKLPSWEVFAGESEFACIEAENRVLAHFLTQPDRCGEVMRVVGLILPVIRDVAAMVKEREPYVVIEHLIEPLEKIADNLRDAYEGTK